MLSPFTIDVPESSLEDLRERLYRVRWPSDEEGGLDRPYLGELVDHWRDRYDWRACESALNRLSQVRGSVGGARIHAVHVRGRGPRPLPLLLSTGGRARSPSSPAWRARWPIRRRTARIRRTPST